MGHNILGDMVLQMAFNLWYFSGHVSQGRLEERKVKPDHI